MDNFLANVDQTWIMVITILVLITIFMWIFLPWVIWRIEGNVIKARKALEEMRYTMESVQHLLESIKEQGEVDIELGRADAVSGDRMGVWK